MTVYVLRDVGVATEKNPSFPKGEVHINYIGKSGYVKDNIETLIMFDDYYVRRQYACKKAEAINENNRESFKRYPFWDEKCDVVEVVLDEKS